MAGTGQQRTGRRARARRPGAGRWGRHGHALPEEHGQLGATVPEARSSAGARFGGRRGLELGRSSERRRQTDPDWGLRKHRSKSNPTASSSFSLRYLARHPLSFALHFFRAKSTRHLLPRALPPARPPALPPYHARSRPPALLPAPFRPRRVLPPTPPHPPARAAAPRRAPARAAAPSLQRTVLPATSARSPRPSAYVASSPPRRRLAMDHLIRSMRRRVVPPSSCDGRMAEDLLNAEQFDGEDAYTGATEIGYYTDLLVNGVEESQDAARTSDPTIHQPPATGGKSSHGRSKNFSTEEDCLLVSAWLNVGMDPIQGVDQSQSTYWTRISDYFHANRTFESTRTTISLMNRWSGIQHDVNVFCDCVSRIETRNRSGSRDDDKIANACALFKPEDKNNRKFTLMHCWNILKDEPNWIERRKEIGCAKKQATRNIRQWPIQVLH